MFETHEPWTESELTTLAEGRKFISDEELIWLVHGEMDALREFMEVEHVDGCPMQLMSISEKPADGGTRIGMRFLLHFDGEEAWAHRSRAFERFGSELAADREHNFVAWVLSLEAWGARLDRSQWEAKARGELRVEEQLDRKEIIYSAAVSLDGRIVYLQGDILRREDGTMRIAAPEPLLTGHAKDGICIVGGNHALEDLELIGTLVFTYIRERVVREELDNSFRMPRN